MASPRRPYAALPLLWTALVLVLTLAPAHEMPRTPAWKLLSFDTAAHAGVFAVLAGLYWFSLRRQCRWPRAAPGAGTIALLGSVALGGVIEVLQHTMNLGRHAEWSDWLSDTLGAVLVIGTATAWTAGARRKAGPLASWCWAGLLLGLAAIGASPAQGQDLARARRTIEKLASPGLHGRGYVQQGERKAAAYLRGRLRELKLEPLAPGYTQPFKLDVNAFPGKVKLKVHRYESNSLLGTPFQKLRAGHDFIAAPTSGPYRVARPYVQRLDTTIFADTAAARTYFRPHNGFTDRSCSPCLEPILLMRRRDEERLKNLPRETHDRIQQRGWLVLVPKLTASLASTQQLVPRLEVLANKWPMSATRLEIELKIDAQLLRNYPTQNLAAIIRGTVQPDSFLVISAHYDHLGTMGRKVYFPGANDNASGVALLLELAAHYARPEHRPAYSVVFLLFGAEEAGLMGSRYFVAHPLVSLKRIKFLMNLDLLGTGEQGATVVNGRLLDAPYRRLVALNDAKRYLPQLVPRGRAANSDHFPFSEAGVPAFFLYTRGGSTAYHDVHDRSVALSLAGFSGAFGLVRDFLGELGAAPATKNSR